MRTAYRCRAYPDAIQQVMLNRTFGCVRVVWNRTLAARQIRYAAEGRATSYAEADAALTAMKRDPEFAWLGEVSSVQLGNAQAAVDEYEHLLTRPTRKVAGKPGPDCRGAPRVPDQLLRPAMRMTR